MVKRTQTQTPETPLATPSAAHRFSVAAMTQDELHPGSSRGHSASMREILREALALQDGSPQQKSARSAEQKVQRAPLPTVAATGAAGTANSPKSSTGSRVAGAANARGTGDGESGNALEVKGRHLAPPPTAQKDEGTPLNSGPPKATRGDVVERQTEAPKNAAHTPSAARGSAFVEGRVADPSAAVEGRSKDLAGVISEPAEQSQASSFQTSRPEAATPDEYPYEVPLPGVRGSSQHDAERQAVERAWNVADRMLDSADLSLNRGDRAALLATLVATAAQEPRAVAVLEVQDKRDVAEGAVTRLVEVPLQQISAELSKDALGPSQQLRDHLQEIQQDVSGRNAPDIPQDTVQRAESQLELHAAMRGNVRGQGHESESRARRLAQEWGAMRERLMSDDDEKPGNSKPANEPRNKDPNQESKNRDLKEPPKLDEPRKPDELRDENKFPEKLDSQKPSDVTKHPEHKLEENPKDRESPEADREHEHEPS